MLTQQTCIPACPNCLYTQNKKERPGEENNAGSISNSFAMLCLFLFLLSAYACAQECNTGLYEHKKCEKSASYVLHGCVVRGTDSFKHSVLPAGYLGLHGADLLIHKELPHCPQPWLQLLGHNMDATFQLCHHSATHMQPSVYHIPASQVPSSSLHIPAC